jgi:hypothetical protein
VSGSRSIVSGGATCEGCGELPRSLHEQYQDLIRGIKSIDAELLTGSRLPAA